MYIEYMGERHYGDFELNFNYESVDIAGFYIDYEGIASSTAPSFYPNDSWLHFFGYDGTINENIYGNLWFGENEDYETRESYVDVIWDSDHIRIYITQTGFPSPADATASIWKDTYFTFPLNKLTYIIKDEEDNAIFTGRAVARPDEASVRVNINKICENYLSQDIDSILEGASAQTNTNAVRFFSIYDDDERLLSTFRFLYDWSYENSWDGNPRNLSHPVNGHYTDGMMKIHSEVNMEEATTYATGGDYPTYFKCADYALYYVNTYGGWDAFLFEGSVVKKDTITSYNTSRFVDNSSVEFETERYATDIVSSYVAKTGWLDDEESQRFAYNIVGTTKAYLHNLKDGTIKPVIITDNSVEYQTFKTNGRKFCQYTLNIKESVTKHRR